MRIIKQDLKGGTVRVRIESADDLWTLKGAIAPGDTARGSTERKLRIGDAKEGKAATVRKRVTLTLAVEKVAYAPDGSSLRVLGAITDGPDDVPRGDHHSLVLEPGEEVTIGKREWPGYLLAKLRDATREDAALLVLLFDREEAKLYGVTRRGVAELARIKGKVAKKDLETKGTADFYKEIVALLTEHDGRGRYAHIVAGAPAFWKEYLQKELPPGLRKKTVLTTISAVERTAIRELLARPEVAKLLRESSTMRELALVEETLAALGKERLAYGDAELREAVETGNAAKVIVTEAEIAQRREADTFHWLEGLLRTAEAARAEVHVLASEEAQRKLEGLGGVVAIRRW